MTARATARASASSVAPETWQVTSVVAPSPSAACCRASVSSHRLDRPCQLLRLARALARPVAAPAAPDASRKTVSFVDVSPSTLSWSHVRAAAGRSSEWRSAGSAAASVRTTESIVAIRGWIIPTPLAMPVTRIGRTARPSGSGQRDRRPSRPWTACRSCGAPRRRPPAVVGRCELRDQRRDPGRDPVERQPGADDARREQQRPLRRDPERLGKEPRDLAPGRRRRPRRSPRWQSRSSR